MVSKAIARINNQFVLKSHYKLSANEQKLILFLISKIDPERDKKDFTTQRVKITEIEKAFAGKKKWNSIYERVTDMCIKISKNPIILPKGLTTKEGKQITLPKVIHWFRDIDPYVDDDKDIAIKFQFDEKLKDFLLELSQYVRINIDDIVHLRGKHSIRMYQIFKAERQRISEYKKVAVITYGLEELKAILGIEGKYKDRLRNFTNRVVEPMKLEINEHSTEINIDYQYLKTRRKVTAIEFKVFDAPKKKTETISIPEPDDRENYIPTAEDIEKLTYAQLRGYTILQEFGIYEGIIYRQIIPTIGAGDLKGYEDLFIKNALDHFLKWTDIDKKNKEAQRGAFVSWWTKKKVFDSQEDNTVYWKIADKVREDKDKMTPDKRESRLLAKGIPHKEFVKLFNEKPDKQKITGLENLVKKMDMP